MDVIFYTITIWDIYRGFQCYYSGYCRLCGVLHAQPGGWYIVRYYSPCKLPLSPRFIAWVFSVCIITFFFAVMLYRLSPFGSFGLMFSPAEVADDIHPCASISSNASLFQPFHNPSSRHPNQPLHFESTKMLDGVHSNQALCFDVPACLSWFNTSFRLQVFVADI